MIKEGKFNGGDQQEGEGYIYLNAMHAKENHELFLTARRKLKVENGFKYVWITNEGKVLVRKEENSKILCCQNLNMVDELALTI
jgi:hypothetical protein